MKDFAHTLFVLAGALASLVLAPSCVSSFSIGDERSTNVDRFPDVAAQWVEDAQGAVGDWDYPVFVADGAFYDFAYAELGRTAPQVTRARFYRIVKAGEVYHSIGLPVPLGDGRYKLSEVGFTEVITAGFYIEPA